MKYEFSSYAATAARPDWTYSVQAPQILSPLWVLERLAGLSVRALITLTTIAVFWAPIIALITKAIIK